MSSNTFILMTHTSYGEYRFTTPGTVWRMLNKPDSGGLVIQGRDGAEWYIAEEDAITLELSKLEAVIYGVDKADR